VICKDCKVLINESRELQGIELCERHAEMERKLATLEALFANVEDEARERRRYALLIAAALLKPHVQLQTSHNTSAKAVSAKQAEELLAEIEKREGQA
jgi:hypothetical protein